MNILLIEPPYFRLLGEQRKWLPLGLSSIASALKASGHSVYVYNADAVFSTTNEHVLSYADRFFNTKYILDKTPIKLSIFSEMLDIINEYRPDIIGLSVKTDCVPIVVELIDLIKLNSNAKIILGGPHFNISFDYKIFSKANAVAIGEVDVKATNIIDKIANSSITSFTVFDCSNHFPRSLDSLPILDYSNIIHTQDPLLFPLNKSMLSTARGCPFHCSFCYKSINSPPLRFLRGDSIINIMRKHYTKYGISKFYIVDDTFGISDKQIDMMISTMMKSNYDFKWNCMSHVKVLNRPNLYKMKSIGCNAIHLGVESGSDRLLNLCGKNIKSKDIVDCSNIMNDLGIELKMFLMIGLPTETDDDIKKTKELILQANPGEIASQVYQPYPQTTLYNSLLNKNVKINHDWVHFRRYDLNYDLWPGQSKKDVLNRISSFLYFTDEWNTTHGR